MERQERKVRPVSPSAVIMHRIAMIIHRIFYRAANYALSSLPGLFMGLAIGLCATGMLAIPLWFFEPEHPAYITAGFAVGISLVLRRISRADASSKVGFILVICLFSFLAGLETGFITLIAAAATNAIWLLVAALISPSSDL